MARMCDKGGDARRGPSEVRAMYESIFSSTTIPVMEQVLRFTEARHDVLAGNIANLDTPGYRVRDLSVDEFHSRLREAIESRDRATARGAAGRFVSPGELPYLEKAPPHRDLTMAEVVRDPKSILYHDDSNVGIEHQVTEMVKNQMQHNLALAIMTSQFRLLQTAISERV
jgi:flagellar basal-body rod protein FlgB